MGSCESENNENKSTHGIRRKLGKQDDRERNEKDKVSDSGSNGKGLKERKLHISHSMKDVDRVIANVFRSICVINFQTASGPKSGHGFLMGFWIGQEKFYCFITNSHLIPKELFNERIEISISYDRHTLSTKIILNDARRYKKDFMEDDLDITVIQMLKEDNVEKYYFMFPDCRNLTVNDLIKYPIFVPRIINTNNFNHIRSVIKTINEFEFTFADIPKDLVGNPIILEDSVHVIGIVKEVKDDNHAIGVFIHPAVNILKDKILRIREAGRYEKGKYVWDNGKYYLGEFNNSNNLPNGKGVKYNPDGTKLFEGNFVDGRFEGVGRYYYKNGRFFIGNYKNGFREGKGIIYYENGKVMFESNYVEDRREGPGKFVCEDGSYYIGSFENGLFNGKGREYYSNGKPRYKGDYVDGKREGKGKYIWRDGEYYVGHEKNDLRHGKGTQYAQGGGVLKKGWWEDDEFVKQCSDDDSEYDDLSIKTDVVEKERNKGLSKKSKN